MAGRRPLRQLRALLQHRIQLVRLWTLLRNRIHAALVQAGPEICCRLRGLGSWPS